MLIKGPPLVMPPPYSIPTMVWLYLACFWTSAPQVPWMMLALMGIEGASLFIRRDLSETLIWESEVQKKEKKGILELGGVLKKGLRLIGAYQYKLSLIVSALERAKNSISFADTLGSVMLYAALAFLCLVASILISMMPVGLPWFLVGAGALLPPYVKLYKLYMGHSKICNAEKRKNPDFFDRFKMSALSLAENFLNHLPDQYELAHRYYHASHLFTYSSSQNQGRMVGVVAYGREYRRLAGFSMMASLIFICHRAISSGWSDAKI
eukprot:jgi/Bigna1/88848/estExt_fgenesh1_pg.C_390064